MTAYAGFASLTHAATITNPDDFLDHAEAVDLKDHPRFVQMLAQIHREAPSLSETQQWRLRYLDAWEAMFEGNYAQCEGTFHQIIDHSGDRVLIGKASALLLKMLAINRRYEEAFELANRLASQLPEIKDPLARFTLLTNLSETLDFANQTDLAVQYAHMAGETVPPGETQCRPLLLQAAALYNGKQLTSASPQLRRAIDVCTAARQPVLANAMWLVLANLYLDESQPSKALALLDQVAPSIRAVQFYPHMLSSRVERAQAYLALGQYKQARATALDALAISRPNDTGEWVMNGYQTLYQVEKKLVHSAAATAYYEHYSALQKSQLDDLRARALAYDMAEQRLLVQKMEAERLSKRNGVLRLQQDLASKEIRADRLSLALLLLALVSLCGWVAYLKGSQRPRRGGTDSQWLDTQLDECHRTGEGNGHGKSTRQAL